MEPSVDDSLSNLLGLSLYSKLLYEIYKQNRKEIECNAQIKLEILSTSRPMFICKPISSCEFMLVHLCSYKFIQTFKQITSLIQMPTRRIVIPCSHGGRMLAKNRSAFNFLTENRLYCKLLRLKSPTSQ